MTRTKAELAAIERDDGVCIRCGRLVGYGMPYSVHHRLPRSGGTKEQVDRVENLVTVCGTGTSAGHCHQWIHAHPKDSYATGWSVRRGADPAAQPLITTTGVMLILLLDGSVVSNSLAGVTDDPPF